jgi:hypothetical protein
MKKGRRNFITVAGAAGIGALFGVPPSSGKPMNDLINTRGMHPEDELSLIGRYGPWAKSLTAGRLPSHSFRNKRFTDAGSWRPIARTDLQNRLAMPERQSPLLIRSTTLRLHIQELSWQLPYGPPTNAILLKPQNATGPLPAF